MQDPNADTEWNDILRAKGILPPKEEPTVDEETVVKLLEDTVQERLSRGGDASKPVEDMTLDELEEMEDEADEQILLEYRQKRIAEMLAMRKKEVYGSVREITGVDYVDEVNKAGDGVWVVLHLYQSRIPLCALISQHLGSLASKFPATKFLKSVATSCIPNYPDKNLPTVFVYYEGDLKGQIVGPFEFGGMNLTMDELEWKLSQIGAVKTELTKDPKKKHHIQDVMTMTVGGHHRDPDDSDDDSD